MQRKFLSNLLILQLLNWLIKPVWIFWIEVKVQNTLQDEQYGAYYAVFGLALLFNILLDFGLNNYVASRVAAAGDHHIPKSVLRFRMGLAAGYIVLVSVAGLLQGMQPWLLALVVLNQVLAGFTLFYRAVLQGRHLFRTDSLASVADRLVAIVLLSACIGTGFFDRENGMLIFLLSQTAGYLTALGFSWFYARKGVQTAEQGDAGVAQLLKSTAWFAALAFAMSVFTRVDTQMLRALAGEEAVGLYARSFRFLDAALIFSTLISSQLLPLFSRMISKGEDTDGLAWLNTRIILFVALPLAAMGLFFYRDVLELFYAPGPAEAVLTENKVFHLLTMSFLPMALVHVFGTWLTAAGKLKYLSICAAGCMLLNVLLNLYLIPVQNAAGAAMACLLTQSVFAVLCISGTVRLGGFRPVFGRLLLLLLWAGAAAFAFALWKNEGSGLPMMAAAGGTWLMLSLLTGLFWPEMKKLLR